jgi:hypothetical protein
MMSIPPPLNGDPKVWVRTAQIICAALIAGVFFFLGITQVIGPKKDEPFLAYFAAGFAALMIVMRFVVPAIAVRNQIQSLPEDVSDDLMFRLFQIYQNRMIIGLALLEGAAFFNLIAYLTAGQIWTLAVVGLLLVLMLMMFPTLNQFENWAEDRKRDLQSRF